MTPRIVAVGEVLWDMLPSGRQLGGAPGNFVCHARALGAEGRLITQVGDDALGREVVERFVAKRISTETIGVDPMAPTGTVSVELSAEGQPTFTIHEGAAWDRLGVGDGATRAAAACDAICFGTLGQRSPVARESIRRLVSQAPVKSLRILDINLRAPYFDREVVEQSLRLANVLKLNDQELPILAGMLGLHGSVDEMLADLLGRCDLRLVALTRGAEGSIVLTPEGRSECAGLATDVVDTIGAGDSFTAAVALGVLKGWELDRINLAANRVAAYVCSQAGATPELTEEIKSEFK